MILMIIITMINITIIIAVILIIIIIIIRLVDRNLVAPCESITQTLVGLPVKHHLVIIMCTLAMIMMLTKMLLTMMTLMTCWPLTYSMVSLWSSPATVSH